MNSSKSIKHSITYLLAVTALTLVFSTQAAAQEDFRQAASQKDTVAAKSDYIDGLAEFEKGNYEKALDLLTNAYIKLPGHAGITYALSDAYFHLDDLSNAAFYGKKATQLEPKNKWYHLKLAKIYRRSGQNQATIDQLNTALEYHPNATDLLYELAQVYADHGEYLKSNQAYNRLIKINGSEITLHMQKLQNFDELGMQDSAIVELQQIRQLDPDNLQTLQLLSNYYQQMDQPSQAKQMLHKALEKNSRDPKTLVMLADIYVKETQWDSVSILLSNVIADPIIQKEAKLDVARYLFSRFNEEPGNNGLKNATEEVISKFTKHEPEYGQAHALAADFYLNTGETGKGIEALAKTNELMPGNDAAWIERLRLLYVDGRYEEAAEVGEKADEHVPQETMILYLTGLSHLAIGQHKEAVDWLQKATTTPARKNIKSGIYDALASSYESLDQWKKASEAYETAIDIDPGNHQALNNYAYNLAVRDEQLERAEEMALKAIRMVDSDNARASYLDTVGWIYFKKQDYEKARTYIQKSIDTGEASAEVLEHMGDVLEKLDRTEEARQWWRKALDKDSTRTYLKDKLSD